MNSFSERARNHFLVIDTTMETWQTEHFDIILHLWPPTKTLDTFKSSAAASVSHDANSYAEIIEAKDPHTVELLGLDLPVDIKLQDRCIGIRYGLFLRNFDLSDIGPGKMLF